MFRSRPHSDPLRTLTRARPRSSRRFHVTDLIEGTRAPVPRLKERLLEDGGSCAASSHLINQEDIRFLQGATTSLSRRRGLHRPGHRGAAASRPGTPPSAMIRSGSRASRVVIREMTRSTTSTTASIWPGHAQLPAAGELVEAAHGPSTRLPPYAITWGTPRLRQAIAEKYRTFYAWRSRPTGTSRSVRLHRDHAGHPARGAQIRATRYHLRAFYENYGRGCISRGGRAGLRWRLERQLQFDPDRLARAVTSRTRAVVFNSRTIPPQGLLAGPKLQVIADLCSSTISWPSRTRSRHNRLRRPRPHPESATLPAWPTAP